MIKPAVLAMLCTLSGCYFSFGTRPSPDRASCTRSRALPIADTVIAAEGAFATGLGLLGLFGTRDDGSLPAGEAKAYGALALAVGLPMLVGNGLSAYSGYHHTARCRAMFAGH